jgi:TetR/AcrR family transcriptional regulator, transcriptional repressor for nem operon
MIRAKKEGKSGRPVRSRDPQESRRALIDAAAQIFNTVGFHGTDTNRIAIAAGYTPGTFYTHFADKREIFLEVYRRWVDEELVAISAAVTASDPSSRRQRLAKTILEHHRTWRIFRKSLRALYAIDEHVHQARLAERERQINLVISQAKARNRRLPSRAEALASLLITEMLCDAIADGDSKALRIPEREMFDMLIGNMGWPK